MDVFERVKKVVAKEMCVEEEAVTMSTSIADDLGADSLDIVELLNALDDEFDLEIPDDQIENIKTIEDVVKYIEERVDT